MKQRTQVKVVPSITSPTLSSSITVDIYIIFCKKEESINTLHDKVQYKIYYIQSHIRLDRIEMLLNKLMANNDDIQYRLVKTSKNTLCTGV